MISLSSIKVTLIMPCGILIALFSVQVDTSSSSYLLFVSVSLHRSYYTFVSYRLPKHGGRNNGESRKSR